jgi:hypothetical protein
MAIKHTEDFKYRAVRHSNEKPPKREPDAEPFRGKIR